MEPPRRPPKVPMKPSEKVKQQLERLGVSVRGSPRALMVAVALVSFYSGTAHSPGKGEAFPYPKPHPSIQLDTQIQDPLLVGAWALSQLPEPHKRQRKPPCDTDLEKEIEGYCWIPVKRTPPCPTGKSFEHDGACYIQAISPPRMPTTGGGHSQGIASPTE
jgi:hypothetical protein